MHQSKENIYITKKHKTIFAIPGMKIEPRKQLIANASTDSLQKIFYMNNYLNNGP